MWIRKLKTLADAPSLPWVPESPLIFLFRHPYAFSWYGVFVSFLCHCEACWTDTDICNISAIDPVSCCGVKWLQSVSFRDPYCCVVRALQIDCVRWTCCSELYWFLNLPRNDSKSREVRRNTREKSWTLLLVPPWKLLPMCHPEMYMHQHFLRASSGWDLAHRTNILCVQVPPLAFVRWSNWSGKQSRLTNYVGSSSRKTKQMLSHYRLSWKWFW